MGMNLTGGGFEVRQRVLKKGWGVVVKGGK